MTKFKLIKMAIAGKIDASTLTVSEFNYAIDLVNQGILVYTIKVKSDDRLMALLKPAKGRLMDLLEVIAFDDSQSLNGTTWVEMVAVIMIVLFLTIQSLIQIFG